MPLTKEEIQQEVVNRLEVDAKTTHTELARLSDSQKSIQATLASIDSRTSVVEKTPEPGKLEDSNMFGKIADMKVFDIPIGAAAFGLLAGGIGDGISGLVQGMVPSTNVTVQKYLPAGIKLGLAFVTAKYGKKLVGPTAANLGAFVFTMDAIEDIVDIRGLVSGLFPTGTKTTSMTRAGARTMQYRPNVVSQANRVAKDYYAAAEGK